MIMGLARNVEKLLEELRISKDPRHEELFRVFGNATMKLGPDCPDPALGAGSSAVLSYIEEHHPDLYGEVQKMQ